MIFETPLLRGKLLRRYRRFLADVELDTGEVILAHCPNSGSMLGCNVPGSEVCVSPQFSEKRRLQYTLEMVRVDGGWVGINTLLSNRIVAEAFERDLIPAFRRYGEYRSEVKLSTDTRIDFALGKAQQCLVEVKNVSLVIDGVARFPDSVTSRGVKHLEHLMAHVRAGGCSYMLFVVQHHGGTHFGPADAIDPVYGRTLRQAVDAGVKIEAWRAHVSPQKVELAERMKVKL